MRSEALASPSRHHDRSRGARLRRPCGPDAQGDGLPANVAPMDGIIDAADAQRPEVSVSATPVN